MRFLDNVTDRLTVDYLMKSYHPGTVPQLVMTSGYKRPPYLMTVYVNPHKDSTGTKLKPFVSPHKTNDKPVVGESFSSMFGEFKTHKPKGKPKETIKMKQTGTNPYSVKPKESSKQKQIMGDYKPE